MRMLSTGLAVAALLALGACANNNTRPTDTGSMALPAQGTTGVVTSVPPGRDVGSMQLPSQGGGVVSRGSTLPAGADTGSMALPGAAQGNSTPRRY